MTRIPLDEPLPLPKEVSMRERPQGTLVIAKQNPTWLVADETETAILEQLLEGKSVRDAATAVYKQGQERGGEGRTELSASTVEESTKGLLGKLEEFGFYEGRTEPDDGKMALHLYLTSECQLRCKHCYKNAGKKFENELKTDEIREIIDAFSKQGPTQIVLSGGEPLLREDFFEITEYIKSKGHQVNVVSNGIEIRDRAIAKRLAETVDFLQISLDGATKEKNDYYRGKGTYEKIIPGIKQFEGLDFTVNIGMVVSEENVDDIKENLQSLVEEKLSDVHLKINVSGLMDYGRGAYCKSAGTSRDYVEEVFETAAEIGIKQKQWRLPNTKAYDCGYARSVTIDANGDVYYCPVAHEALRAGLNVRETPIEEIIDIFHKENASVSVEHMAACHDCDLEYLCGGGCRLDNKVTRGDALKPECSEEKKELIYEELVKLRTG